MRSSQGELCRGWLIMPDGGAPPYPAVVMAGSVVTRSIPPLTMVQGNPAKPVARCGSALLWDTPIKEFYSKLRPLQ